MATDRKKFEDDDEIEVPKDKKKAGPAVDEEDDFAPGAKDAKKTHAVEVSEDDDCEFGDEKLMYRGDGLDRLRPDKGAAVRFAIIPFLKPKKAVNHYIDKKGTFRCTSTDEGEGLCCKALNSDDNSKAQLHIVAVVVHYTNANSKTGKYAKEVVDTEWDLKFVNLSRANFSDISALVQEDETVDGFDIVMTHRENGIGYKVSRASSEARWKKKGLAAEVKEACAKFEDGTLLTKKLGKRLTPIEWKALLSTLGGEEDEGDNSDL
jgi:hypothetical protein